MLAEKERSLAGYVLMGTGMLVLISLLSVVYMVLSAPSRVVSKTLDTNNIIQNYEWFYQTESSVVARQAQIATYAKLLASERDVSERAKMVIELTGMQQSCRDMVTTYNARSQMANREMFKSRSLPEQLNPNSCEVK